MNWPVIQTALFDELEKLAVTHGWVRQHVSSAVHKGVPESRVHDFINKMKARGLKAKPRIRDLRDEAVRSADKSLGLRRIRKYMEKNSASRTEKDRLDKAIEAGIPIAGGAGIGRTLSDLSLSTDIGASPRRKTIGALLGAMSGLGVHLHQKKKQKVRREARAAVRTATKTAAPFTFKGTATKRFLSKPGKTIHDLSPKIGRLGALPT